MKDLVKNPLGIIALFISLIYSIANLLLGSTAESLTPEERWPIIIFIVLFPVIVLGVFYFLVSRHHWKLYAPGDYIKQEMFYQLATPREREEKLKLEVSEALPTLSRNMAQHPEPLVSDFANRKLMRAEFLKDLQIVESKVVAKFETELNQRAIRHIKLGDTRAIFDAVFENCAKRTFLEIKLFPSPEVGNISLIRSMLYRVLKNAVVADNFFDSNFKLILTIVHSLEDEALRQLQLSIEPLVEECAAEIDLRFIHRSELNI